LKNIKINIASLLCLLIYLLVTHSSIAQNFDFKHYNVEDGLPQSQVNSIFQDSRGYLWIGTAGGGICQFDGTNFIQYTEKDGLAGDIITDIIEDKEGNIWSTSTLGGITKYNGRKFTKYTDKDGLIANSANMCLLADNSKRVWIGSQFGLSIYENGNFSTPKNHPFFQTSINQIIQDSKQNIWLATNQGIIFINSKDTIQINTSNGLISNQINCINEDGDGNFLIGSNAGATKLLSGSVDNRSHFEFESIVIPNDANVKSIITDKDKDIWYATSNYGAFVQHTNSTISQITKNNGLKNNHLIKIFEDKSGNLWIGTSGSGLIKLGTKAFTYYDNIEGLNSHSIYSIIEDNNQNIWVSTGDEGIYKYDGEKIVHFDERNGVQGKSFRSSVKDKNGNLWFASERGLVKYSNGRFTTYTTANGLPTNNIKTLLIKRNGDLWIGTNGAGLVHYDFKKFTIYNTKQGNITHDYIHSLFEDSKGNLWFGTGSGVNKYSKGKFTNYANSKGFCNLYIGSIAEDKNGNMWFGTDRCVVRYDGVDFKPITIEDGLSSNVIYLLLGDKRGNIWVGTNKGIDKISLNSYGHINKIKNYNAPEGFRGIECNSRAIYEDQKENLWIGTVSGLIKYNPKEDKSNIFEPVIHLNKVKLFFEDVNWLNYSKDFDAWNNLPKNVTLEHNENHLTFEFSGINLTHPEYVQYSFKLEPIDKDWFPSTKKTSATYSNLSPGKYVFNVKARNNDGIWTQQAATFEFTIEAAFWETWWFYVVIAIIILYLLFKITSFKEKQQIKVSKELEKKVRERTILIEKQRDEKEILLKEIHHRVKNNLQVINSLLSIQSSYTSDPKSLALFDEAKNRIRSMALIHEKMYQTGDLAHIDFQDYIIALTNDLISTYSINCDIFLDIKIDEVKFDIDTIIPIGLLLNEIISNTLKYAFVDRKKGRIIMHLTHKSDNTYQLVAGDDGVGMDKNILEQEDVSLGMELIKIFVEQLDGKIERLEKEGTIYQIEFHSREKK